MRIAVTGWTGSGKTTAARYLAKRLGFQYLDVDTLAHGLLRERSIREKMKMSFGISILDRSLEIDKKKLGELVFSDPEKLQVLNRIIHPELILRLRERLEGSSDIVVDLALFEKLEPPVDYVILIESDIDKLYERKRREYSQAQVLNMINNQKLPKDPDLTIRNNGSLEDLKKSLELVLERLGAK